ncbi:MAG: exo-beta-N-acetylmuramidase NamZ domain-containing protein [Saprospiraceae bacterium]
MKLKVNILILFLPFFYLNCSPAEQNKNIELPIVNIKNSTKEKEVKVGAARIAEYFDLINNKNIALVVNQTSTIGDTHLADTLQQLGITIKTIFAPEHGFRGKADAGEKVVDGIDLKTGIPLLSLYGKNKKPKPAQLAGIDLVIFDIQDVGARFYTYISTMHYVMEACAENGVEVLVLDRPNPNGHYVDGPILDSNYQSFVGMHPIPIVHGMTIAEYAQMVNEEGWLKEGVKCKLSTIACENYNHETVYELPIKPSPNLPNNRSIYLYPSLCFFEGTTISVGRGTNTQFQVYGHSDLSIGNYEFTPEPMDGAKYPKLEGEVCKGFDLTKMDLTKIRNEKGLNLDYLITAYQNYPNKKDFFLKNLFFDKLAGGADLRKQIIAGKSSSEIKATWQSGLNQFKKTRAKYLLYNGALKQ